MRILVVNDDGIAAEGIAKLTEAACALGEVWVVAPKEQCSAMSSRITVRGTLEAAPEAFLVPGVRAYSVTGTPADCVKAALQALMPERPDIVFSGINHGYNAGLDIQYSGTVGAATEALFHGIPAIAFSNEAGGSWAVAEHALLPVMRELMDTPIAANEIWNVNFPGCAVEACRGIRRDCIPAQSFYRDLYGRSEREDGSITLTLDGISMTEEPAEGTDLSALREGYISVGRIRNPLLCPGKQTP